MELTPVRKMLDLGLVPVLYGDAVVDAVKGISILSGDQLTVHLACELDAARVVVGIDVDGVFTADPKLQKKAKLVQKITPANWPEVVKSLGGVGKPDVTGGIANKVRELLTLTGRGIEAEIVNAAKPNVLKRAISGERGLGTIITRR
jgi:isopentenyl phosphate kinase